MAYTYALGPENVVTDPQGNVVSGWHLDVYDRPTGGTRVTDMLALDGTPLPGNLTTDATGRYPFLRATENLAVLYLDDGQAGARWAVIALEAQQAAVDAEAEAQRAAASALEAAQSAQRAADNVADAAGAKEAAQQAITEVEQYQTQTATLEELLFSCRVLGWITSNDNIYGYIDGNSNGANISVMVAPFALRIQSVSLAWEYWTTASTNAAYWEVHLSRVAADDTTRTLTSMAHRTTRPTGAHANGDVVARKAWTFDGEDLSSMVVAKGDVIGINPQPGGGPGDMSLGLAVTIRYTPA